MKKHKPYIPNVPTNRTYHFIKGMNGEWESNSDSGLEFTADGAYSDFVRTEIDGKTLDKSSYDVKSGSTIITLKPDYLKTLDAGKHTISAVYTDGSATTNFTVVQHEDIADDEEAEDDDDDIIPDDDAFDEDDDASDDDNASDDDDASDDDSDPIGSTSDENPKTGSSLSGVFAVSLLAITAAGVAIKRKRK